MAQLQSDRNLLFGMLALQMDFLTRDQLVAAMQAWVFEKSLSLGQILVKQEVLDADAHALLDALVNKHLAKHGNDAEKSLSAISAGTSVLEVREELKKVADTDVQDSLGHIGASMQGPADPYATLVPKQGQPSQTGAPASASAPIGEASMSGSRFRILRPHARGGLGEVHVARDSELSRDVALKQIQARHADDRESQARFMLEAEITGGLEHPGIVPVYGLGRYADGRPYYAMRFIRGDSLKEALERFHKLDVPGWDPGQRSLEVRGLLGRLVDVCNAISYAHSRGVLHRDLKPGNIMLGKYGETLVVDWGLAKAQDTPAGALTEAGPGEGTLMPSSASLASQTVMGSAMGTPQYMSPEQAAGRLDLLGPCSDVYSLGATLYAILAGVPPVQETDVGIVLRKVERGQIPPPITVKPQTPRPLNAICMKAMALLPGDRYPSPRELADDIEHWLADEPVSAWAEPWTVKARRWLSRHRTLVTTTAAVVVVATALLAVIAVERSLAKERESVARAEAEHNYGIARAAVDRYHTHVADEVLLNEPGMQPLRKKLLEAAREFYAQFVKENDQKPGVVAGYGKALYRLAQITGDIDSELDAIQLHLKAEKVFADLAAGDPDPEIKSDLASCWHHLGRLYRRTDQLGKAEEAYKKALDIWQPLVETHPKEDSYRAGQARSQLGLGNEYLVARRSDDARILYKKALDTRKKLAEDNPKTAEYKRDLAATYGNLAIVYSALAQKEEKAETAYHDAIAIKKELTRDYPNVTQYQNDLARSNFNLGDLQLELGQIKPAEQSYKTAANLWNALVEKHPAVTDFHINLAEAWSGLAAVYSIDPDKAKDAVTAAGKEIAIWEKLANDFKDVKSYQTKLARGHYHLGTVYRKVGKAPEAEKAFNNALVILEKMPGEALAVSLYAGDLARTYNDLGMLQASQGENKKAADTYRKAVAQWEKLTKAHPDEIDYAVNQSNTAYNLAKLLRSDGNPNGAVDWYAQSIRAFDAVAVARRNDVTVQSALRKAHWKRAETLNQLGRHAESLNDWDKALEFANAKMLLAIQMQRTMALARAGEHVRATAEAALLAAKANGSPTGLYHLGCVYALCSGAALADVNINANQRQPTAEKYAERAIELLVRAHAKGYFKTPANVEKLRLDTDLEAIRSRPEFGKLVDEVGQKGAG